MKFNNNYFEDEVRDGFFVPSEIKRAWAAELEVLSEIDKICKKHNIQYFADWGTLLAAVRHEGFIPWDDDLDIVMKRADYIKFMEVAQTELPEGFSAYNFRNHDNLWLFLGRVVGKRRICFEEEHLERFHEFPYIAGVDIFVLDYVSRDNEKEQKRNELALRTIAIADMIGEKNQFTPIIEQEIVHLEHLCNVQISRKLSPVEMRRRLYEVVELLFGWFKEDEADELTQLFPFGLKGNGYRISKKCYDKSIELPYENTRIPVPVEYCEMLEKKYGDYMRLVRDAGGHDYPFFEAQKKELQAVLDFDIPAYKFTQDQLQCEKDCNGYKDFLKKMQKQLQQMISDTARTCNEQSNSEDEKHQSLISQFQNMQQTAIDIGTFIEYIKGEGTQTVKKLEELCEQIYECSVICDKTEIVLSKLEMLHDKTRQIKQFMQTEILNHKEVVFLIDKAEHWQAVKWYWKKLIENDDVDICIIPVPYYYKKYDGRCYASAFEFDEIEKCIKDDMRSIAGKTLQRIHIVEYTEFDIRQHHPDQIIITNPYDEWNQAITLPEEFYSRNIQKYTEKLVYIVPFLVEEFTKENYREYHNMQYYCTMPGVVRSDVVYVQSENMRNVYIEKLTEFAGEGTKDIWSQKIAVAEKKENLKAPDGASDNMADSTSNSTDRIEKARKKIAFFVQVGLTIQYGDEMFKKLQSVIEIFRGSKEKVELIWIGDKEHDAFLKEYNQDLAEKYQAITREFMQEGWGTYLDRTDIEVSEIAAMCDAYYGSASHIALEFEVKKKPVMIMDVEVI